MQFSGLNGRTVANAESLTRLSALRSKTVATRKTLEPFGLGSSNVSIEQIPSSLARIRSFAKLAAFVICCATNTTWDHSTSQESLVSIVLKKQTGQASHPWGV